MFLSRFLSSPFAAGAATAVKYDLLPYTDHIFIFDIDRGNPRGVGKKFSGLCMCAV